MEENIQGWINLYKPKNISSFFAIKKIRSKLSLKECLKIYALHNLPPALLQYAQYPKTIQLILKKDNGYILIR